MTGTTLVKDSGNPEEINWNWSSAGYVEYWHEPTYNVLARYIDPGSKILEIGAGASHALAALAGRIGCESYGVEPDMDGIEATRRLAEMESVSVMMIEGSGFDLPFDDDEFDFVYSQGLIEHFPEIDAQKLLAEHNRVCRVGGRVIVSVPNLYNFPHTLRKEWLGRDYGYWPERSFTPRQLQASMTEAGLTVTAVDGVLPLWVINDHKYGWRVVAALKRLGLQSRIDNLKNPVRRSQLGYMTYAIGEKRLAAMDANEGCANPKARMD